MAKGWINMGGFLLCALYLLLLGAVSHMVGQALPRHWFSWVRFPFRPLSWERDGARYDCIRIRRWKDHVPDMSRYLGDMVKKQVPPQATAAQVQEVLRETCVAEVVHAGLMLLSLPVFLIWKSRWCILLYGLYNLLGNLPYLLIQRYNRPRLMKLLGRLQQKEAKA